MPIKPENRKRYPKEWPEIRKRIQARAGDRCERCGVPNHSFIVRLEPEGWRFARPLEVTGAVYIILTTAHLDHTPENNEDSNLAFLCQRCHNRHDAKHRAETRSETSRRRNPCSIPD